MTKKKNPAKLHRSGNWGVIEMADVCYTFEIAGQFNIGNLEQLKAIAHVGVRLNIPIIIGVSEGERAYLGVHHVVDFIKSYNDEHSRDGGFRLFLNADHTHSLDKVREAAEAGFDAILFDGGKLSLEENIAQAKEAVKIVKNIKIKENN